ncbi:helix-turn-helix domain-containing protein [Shivajiella indica]|uniref:Helix-turn-helix domain-containing protein n=1 Tax=Shivajiella indica TaxID=872115 RepID=A0ABW5B9J1_9BACT
MKTLLPNHKSLVEEISDLLNISNDSAYRRIRGDKFINLEEIQKICQYFKISLDQMLSLQSDAIVFHGQLNKYDNSSLENWLLDMLAQLQLVASHKQKHIYYLVKDMPPFYHLYHPELASFKFFFWSKSILYYESLKGVNFSLDSIHYQEHRDLCSKIINLYNCIPTTEIWNEEGINTTLRQIDFYKDTGIIPLKSDANRLYQCVLEVIDHLEVMAEAGKKFGINQEVTSESPDYRFFVNEIVIGDNTFMGELDNKRITYLNHSVLYFIATVDKKFNDSVFANLENLMKKSTLISNVGDRERKLFFNKLRKKVLVRMEALEKEEI